jgi:type III secretion system YscQ/HrcQ family protein
VTEPLLIGDGKLLRTGGRELPRTPDTGLLRGVSSVLPRITPAQARAGNLLHAGARSITLNWLGQTLRLVRQRPVATGPWQVQLRLGGYGAALGLDGLQALLPGLDPLAADSAPAVHAALFAQLAAGLWAALGLDGPEPAVTLEPAQATSALDPALAVGLQLHNQRCGARTRACLVFDSPAAAAAFAAAWARLAGPPPQPPADLPLALRFEVGTRRLAPAELRGLQPGDLVLIARLPSREGRWQARILAGAGRSCIGLGHVKGDGIVMEQWQVPKAPRSSAGPADGLLDGVSVELGFEIGHHRMALGELMQLAPGHVFALGANPEGDAVDLVVDGRVIGAGQLVLVGEALGVRVLRLQLEGASPAPVAAAAARGAAAAAAAAPAAA